MSILTAADLRQLMVEAKQGNREAFGLLYREFYTPVFRYLYKRVGHQAVAEDLCQSVFLRVYNSKTEYVDRGKSPVQYLYIVARSVIADHWKKQQKHSAVDIQDLPETAEHSLELSDKLDAQQALQLLDGEYRLVLEKKLLQCYSTREIAQELGKTEASVRQIQCRGLKKIREILQSYA